jgi:hypothetical protein
MSGRFDPTRTSKLELTKAQVARRVNFVSQAKLPDNWQWGMEPFSRDDPPPVVSFSFVLSQLVSVAGRLLPLPDCSLLIS